MICWKFKSLDPNIASTRYRGLKPITLFETHPGSCQAIDGRRVPDWPRISTLIFVKSFTHHDLMLAEFAHTKRIPVILDLCDNIFVDDYTLTGDLEPREIFTEMAQIAAAVVTPTTALADRVRAAVPESVRVLTIPDGIETEDDLRRYRAFLKLPDPNAGIGFRFRDLLRKRDRKQLRRRIRAWLAAQSRRERGTVPPASDSRKLGRKRLLWFGNHGANHANFGMLDLLPLREPLEALARRYEIELVVASNNRHKFAEHINGFDLPTRYVEWTADGIHDLLRKASVVLVPNSREAFSIGKSANRAILALRAGVPVVATRTDAHLPLAECLLFEDWEASIERYLTDPALAAAHVQHAQACIEAHCGDATIRSAWQRLLSEVRAELPCNRVGILFTIIQDLDVLMPVTTWARERFEVDVLVDVALLAKHPYVWQQLAAWRPRLVSLSALDESRELLQGLDVFLTASESSLRPHRLAHKLTEHANRLGVNTLTFQHGFENIGLTWTDEEHPIEQVEFRSRGILTWGGPETFHPRIRPTTAARCMPLGYSKNVAAEPIEHPLLQRHARHVGVFENLHWSRYDDAFRERFLNCLEATARALPQLGFVVRPHQAGRWLTDRYRGELPAATNIIILDPDDPEWRRLTAPRLFANVDAVITTPSTVAADAAIAGRPVALVAGDLDLDNYDPLPMLRDAADWLAFCGQFEPVNGSSRDESDAARRRTEFISRNFVSGDPFERLAGFLSQPWRDIELNP